MFDVTSSPGTHAAPKAVPMASTMTGGILAPHEGSAPLTGLLAAVLDEIDYGMLLVTAGQRVLHANHAARVELDALHPLQLIGEWLRAGHARDSAPLHEALANACAGRRRMVTVGEGAQRLCLAVVPVPQAGRAASTCALVMLGKRQVCQELSVDGFARAHALTPAETQVLKVLCSGARPSQVALRLSVAVSTVRTQVGSIRAKTGAETIGALVRMVAMLPPIVGALRTAAHDPRHATAAATR